VLTVRLVGACRSLITARRCAGALIATALTGACASAVLAASGDELIVREAFTPDRPGASTNLSITARFASSADVPPSPVSKLTLYGPAGLGIQAQGAGTCTEATLQERGPEGCPRDSLVGFGGGVAELDLPRQLVRESFTLDFFFASRQPKHLAFLIYASGVLPVATSLVIVAKEIPAPKPYGLGFNIQVPQVSTVPGAANASIESAFATLGASNVTYLKTVHHRRTLVHIKGLIVPKRCPTGGFPTRGSVQFADGESFTVNPTIPCPRS
jgi:hypothetical protein